MAMPEKWKKRYELLKMLAYLSLICIPCFLTSILTEGFIKTIALVSGALFLLPLLIYVYIVTIWHWKDRYLGGHSDLWGALLLIETTGWLKLLYIFRHIIPDAKSSGRYRERNRLYALRAPAASPHPMSSPET